MKKLLLLVVFLLTGCVAPLQPAPPAPEAEEAVCAYPLLNALASSKDRTVATDQTRLDAIARQFDSAHLAVSAARWQVPGTGLTVMQYMERANPDLTRWAYIPGGFFYPRGLFDCNNHGALCGASALIGADDWMYKPDGTMVKTQGEGQLLNPTTGVQERLGAYWAGWLPDSGLDGIHWDLNETTMNREGGHVDLNRNGVSDRSEFGLPWLDARYVEGHLTRLAQMTGGRHIGNGAWQPGQEAYYAALDGVFIELGMAWRDPATGVWRPDRPETLRWQLELAQRWRAANPDDALMWIASTYLLTDSYWSRFWNDHPDAVRVALALALLTDGELVLEAPVQPRWCDECGVRNGSTSRLAGAGDWLGCPTTAATCTGGLCWREFQGGMVFLNLGPQALQTIPPAGYSTIRGWYDTTTNHGGAWDGWLTGHNALVLWRTPAPAPTETPTATQTPTAAPTATATATPTLSVEQRLDAIDQQVIDILRRMKKLEAKP